VARIHGRGCADYNRTLNRRPGRIGARQNRGEKPRRAATPPGADSAAEVRARG